MFKIVAYHGQHDEAGALIALNGQPYLSTPSISGGDWKAYAAKNKFILDALNEKLQRDKA